MRLLTYLPTRHLPNFVKSASGYPSCIDPAGGRGPPVPRRHPPGYSQQFSQSSIQCCTNKNNILLTGLCFINSPPPKNQVTVRTLGSFSPELVKSESAVEVGSSRSRTWRPSASSSLAKAKKEKIQVGKIVQLLVLLIQRTM